MSQELADAEARRVIEEVLDESLLVEASAGTGKTWALIQRLVCILARGARADQIVAVTFTKKAAGELRLRLRSALEAARPANEETHPILEAIAHLEEARIGTLHGFCADLLRERPVEAGIDPRFEELSEADARALFDRVFDRWLSGELRTLPSPLHRALLRPLGYGKTASERLRTSAWALAEERDLGHTWAQAPFDREGAIERLFQESKDLATLSHTEERSRSALAVATEPVRAFARLAEDLVRAPLDDREAALLELDKELKIPKSKPRGQHRPGVTSEAVHQALQQLKDHLEVFSRDAEADLAPLLREALTPLLELYRETKRRLGKVDFPDLLVLARDLVRDHPEVRRAFQERFKYIFVDEFQDTDPLQMEIVLLLAAKDPDERDWRRVVPEPGKLFLVGDPKQSIYGFRRADVVLYQDVKAQLLEAGVRRVHLTQSFRSAPDILRLVNAAFAPLMIESEGQPGYVPLTWGSDALSGAPPVIALPVPHPYDGNFVRDYRVNAELPSIAARMIAWMLRESGWQVRDPATRALTPLAPEHIAVLFRSRTHWETDLIGDLAEQLTRLGVPNVVFGASQEDRDEREALRQSLTAIEWPDDELAVYATLRGPLFAFSDDQLLLAQQTLGRLHAFRPRGESLPETTASVGRALDILRDLHEQRAQRPIAETVSALLGATRAMVGFAFDTRGERALGSILGLLDEARAFESAGGLSFRRFVESLDPESRSTRAREAPLLEESSSSVRLLTVHAAKGLEFPVVMMGEMATPLQRRNAWRFVDAKSGTVAMRINDCAPADLMKNQDVQMARERAESIRLAYVAATRARDVLIIPALGTQGHKSWLEPFHPVLYPPRAMWNQSSPAPHCPEFKGDRTVFNAPVESERGVRPGLIKPEVGEHSVVWWDPGLLTDPVRPQPGGVRAMDALKAPSEIEGDPSVDTYFEWATERRVRRTLGQRPTCQPFAPAETPYPSDGARFSIEESSSKPSGTRPGGRRFGTLVHAILNDIPLDQPTEAKAIAQMHGRILMATDVEITAAAQAVVGALAHDVLGRAHRSPRMHREYPVVFQTAEGEILDGTIDLLFEENGSWVVVDFKTDADLSTRRAQYLDQMRWYLRAIAEWGQPVRGVLLGV